MERLLTPWRLRTYPRWFLVVLLVPIVVAVATADGSSMVTGRLGGDLPAFYGAGSIVADGDIEHLYDWDTLAASQAGLFGDEEGVFQVFAYPPFVAHAYSVLTLLPYRVAYAVHTVAMLAAIAGAIALLRPGLARVGRWPVEAFALAALFYPLYRAATGGQNTALTLLILAAGYRALDDDRPVAAGAIMGLLLFKPQFAIPVIGLLLLRNWRTVLGAAATGVVLWAWAAALAGVGWVGWWLDGIRAFNEADQTVNGVRSINLIGIAERIFGVGSTPAYVVGGALAGAVVLALMWVWRHPRVPLDLQVAAMTCGILLIPIHVMFYDAGLLVLPFAVVANRHGRASFNRLTALTLLAGAAHLGIDAGFNTLFPTVVLTTIWVADDIRRTVQADPEPAPEPAGLEPDPQPT